MRFLCLLLLSFVTAPLAAAENRVFVSLAGSLLEAEITAVSGDSVTLKRADDQQTLTVSRKTLCKEDNAYISRWQEQHGTTPATAAAPPAPAPAPAAAPSQKYRLVCQTLPAKNTRGASDGDLRTVEVTYTFNLSNQEVRRDLENARGTAITLARNLSDSDDHLIVLQKVNFEINIRAQSKMVYTTPPVHLTYSQDPSDRYGVKTHGYVFIIQDAAGNMIHVEASPDANARYTKEILALDKVPCVVNREFRVQTGSTLPLYNIRF
ncbi:hypothetical protein [Prosthecobacter vanneervenii]|uniref:SLA1 homology domain-containing protein n=1 Tax=Prosthecobacter vanneervenii TaxID=48466 RepID=A0A7W7YE66_9BACT|nr:hypothetical protein [Prosthecobacter vanneervenii]MBB5034230.1 hypothetical protein [Prosthecobacter vanneervenii]